MVRMGLSPLSQEAARLRQPLDEHGFKVLGPPRWRGVRDTHDHVPPGDHGLRMPSERLADPAFQLVAPDIGAHGDAPDRDPQPRRAPPLDGQRRHPNLQPLTTDGHPFDGDAPVVGRRGEPLRASERAAGQGIRTCRPFRRRRRRTARPPGDRMRRRKPWRRFRFRTEVGRKVFFTGEVSSGREYAPRRVGRQVEKGLRRAGPWAILGARTPWARGASPGLCICG